MEGLVTNLDIFVLLKNSKNIQNQNLLLNVIQSKLTVPITQNEHEELSEFCRKYCYNLHQRWLKSGSKGDSFIKKNSQWLEAAIVWPKCVKTPPEESSVQETSEEIPSPSTSSVNTSTTKGRKPFKDLGRKQKKRRVEPLQNLESQQLAFATSMRMKANGNEDIAAILDYLLENPQDIESVKEFVFRKKKSPIMSSEKSLACLLSLNLSKWQYNSMRSMAQEEGVNLYPSYYAIQQAKLQCYPPKEHITIAEMKAQINLQSLLDLTTKRLLKFVDVEKGEITLFSKWGLDGASNQSNYKQILAQNEDDSCVFMASVVPIKLACGENILWENKTPNSTLLCRPIFFKFMKETKSNVSREVDLLQEEINNLEPTKIGDIKIRHSLLMTMIDGKISSILSETSSQRCDICKARPKEMNDIQLIEQKQCDPDLYKYGLSSLHAWIRLMECILHIAYRLDFKKWIAKEDDKRKMETRKKQIQDDFKTKNGLLIDTVKQGHGSTNDGNTARRFFADIKTTAAITRVDENLIHRLSVILETISSGRAINIYKFKDYAKETYELYIHLYSWYYMPSSLHKILSHGADIIENFGFIPIGILSEEASESRNKDFRQYRQHHARKFCRKATNEDILHNLLLTSDPYLSRYRRKLERKHKTLSRDAINLLISEDDDSEKENIEFVDVEEQDSSDDISFLS